MSSAEIGRLRDAALKALEKGQLREALQFCLELEQREPGDPEWPRRTAKVCRQARMSAEEVEALNRAARIYVKTGDGLKAAAVSKQILGIDARHAETLERMQKLKQISGTPVGPRPGAPARTPAPGVPAPQRPKAAARPAATRAGSWVHKAETIDGIELKSVVTGATKLEDRNGGVYRIPLDDDLEGSVSATLAQLEAEGLADPPVKAPPSFATNPAVRAYGAPVASEDALILSVEDEMRTAARTNAALGDTALFADLDEKLFSELLMSAELKELPKGEEVFHQGDVGHALYVVAEGTVGVIDEGPPRRGISKLGEGDFFGEIALITDRARTATVVALSDVQLIVIDRATIKKLIQKAPDVLTILLRFFRDRSVARLFSSNPLFTSLSERDQGALAGHFRFLEFEPGSFLVEEGHIAPGLLVLLAGDAEAVKKTGDKQTRLGLLGAGDMTGELSILTQKPAIGSVRAVNKIFAIELPGPAFTKIVNARPEALAYIKKVIAERESAARAAVAKGSAPRSF